MSPRSRPPGKTFKERWPHEAEETRYFAATSYAVVVGGVLGVMLVPFGIWHTFMAVPALGPSIAGIVALVTFALIRPTAPGRRWLALAWKIGTWVLAAGALGLVVEGLASAMCDATCVTALPTRSASPVLITYAALVVGSIGIAVLADRGGNALRRRAPSPTSPR
jgi:hypothetical protein